MDKTCSTCDWWKDGVCTNDDSGVYQTGEGGTCPQWENYNVEFWGEEYYKKLRTLVELGGKIPNPNFVSVVRCQECIHWHDWGACGHPDNGFDSPPMGPDDFCSKGEPKNELE